MESPRTQRWHHVGTSSCVIIAEPVCLSWPLILSWCHILCLCQILIISQAPSTSEFGELSFQHIQATVEQLIYLGLEVLNSRSHRPVLLLPVRLLQAPGGCFPYLLQSQAAQGQQTSELATIPCSQETSQGHGTWSLESWKGSSCFDAH